MNHSSTGSEVPRGFTRALWYSGAVAAFLLLLALASPLSCNAQEKTDNPPGKTWKIKVGSQVLDLELARNDDERSLGLMFRRSMEETHGMLFVFERDQTLRFWMKNTLIPLSVAYLSSDGTIKEIHDMTPNSLRGIESVYLVRYALELNQGAFGRLGIKVGDKMELKDWTSLR